MTPRRRNNGPVLSEGFLKRLGIESGNGQGGGQRNGRRPGPQNRKEQRKMARTNKRLQRNGAPQTQFKARPGQQRPGQQRAGHQRPGQQHISQQRPAAQRPSSPTQKPNANDSANAKSSQTQQTRRPTKKDDSEDEDEDAFDGFSSSEDEDEDEDEDKSSDESADEKRSSSKPVSKRDRDRLEQDDAEIAELERKLGIKGRKTLPKAFHDDGLGDLLGEDEEGEDDSEDDEDGGANTSGKKKLSAEDEEWLRAKRRKAASSGGRFVGSRAAELKHGVEDESDGDEGGEDDSDENGDFSDSGEEDDDDDDDSGGSDEPTPPPPPPKRKRENPYVAPVSASSAQKYVPPARRKALESSGAESEEVLRVRKQANRLIARLSDSNMLTILVDIEKMYLENPRKYVTDAVVDKLLEQIIVEGVLSTSVILLIAAFATAVYRIKGSDFGAHFIQRTVALFDERYEHDREQQSQEGGAQSTQGRSWAPSSKAAAHLLSLMAELYNFGMIGPKLIYDYMRLLLEDFNETNTELLLRVVDTSGQFLRKDDPHTLKTLVQSAEARANANKNLPVRSQHMMQQIKDLQKRGGKKKRRDAGGARIEHAVRLKKMLGRLSSTLKVEAAGTLNISLADVKQSESSGKWWLVGARWAGPGGAGAASGGAGR